MGQTPFVEKGDWEIPTLTTLCGVALAGAGLPLCVASIRVSPLQKGS